MFFYSLDNVLIDRVMRLVVWAGVGGYERCMTSWGMSYRYINRTQDLSTNLSFGTLDVQ